MTHQMQYILTLPKIKFYKSKSPNYDNNQNCLDIWEQDITSLSRARRMVQFTFGILASKWCILNRALDTNVTNSKTIIKTYALLHNLVIDKENRSPPQGYLRS
ncbi:unnamed protein product [Gordionus sp. m RMFG-2023]